MILRLVLGILLASPLYAGGQSVGNGGHGVQGTCYRNQGGVKESLDIFEARIRFGRTIDLGDPGLDPYAKVTYALNRLQALDPDRANMYRNWLATFKSEAVFYQNGEVLPDINDYGTYLRLPAGCTVRQIAVQKEPLSPPIEKRYEINGIAFDEFDSNDSRAALILHEIIYRDALEHGHTNSVHVRFLNGLLMSREISTMTKDEYFEYLKKRNFLGYSSIYGNLGSDAQTVRLFPTPMTFVNAQKFCQSFDKNGGQLIENPSMVKTFVDGTSSGYVTGSTALFNLLRLNNAGDEYLRFWKTNSIQSATELWVGYYSRGSSTYNTITVQVPDSNTALALPMCLTPSYNIFGS